MNRIKMVSYCFILGCLAFLSDQVWANGEAVTDCNLENNTMTFSFVDNTSVPATFIFATGHLSTCSLTSGAPDPTFTGDGSVGNPYILTVSPTDTQDSNACGIQLEDATSETYVFTVEIKFGASLIINSNMDQSVEVRCTFNPQTTPALNTLISAEFACDAQKRIYFSYSNAMSTPVDIYAVDRRQTCSMSTGTGSGSATDSNPYQIVIDLSGTQSPDCGVQEISTDVYEVNFIVQTTAFILKADDFIYKVTCNFTEPFSELSSVEGLTVGSELSNGSVTNLMGKATLRVVDETGRPVTQLRLGQSIRLQADLVTSDATGLRVLQCDARPSRKTPITVDLIGSDGCANNNLLESFSSQTSNQASTPVFPAFRFDNADTLIFVCLVDFCYGRDTTQCAGTHCTSMAGRRKRDSILGDEESVSTMVIFSDSTSSAVGGNSTVSVDQPSEQCDDTLYWSVLGVILALTALLIILTGCVLFYCIRTKKKKSNSTKRCEHRWRGQHFEF